MRSLPSEIGDHVTTTIDAAHLSVPASPEPAGEIALTGPEPPAGRPWPRGGERAWAIDVMRRNGLRVSGARRLVLECLLVADGPMSAEQIADGIGGRMLPSDLASVYRNLARLEQNGVVRHVHLGHGPGLYDLALAGEREYLTCERCADFVAVAPAALDDVRAAIEARFGYRASFVHFPIVGLCAACVREVRGEPRQRGGVAQTLDGAPASASQL